MNVLTIGISSNLFSQVMHTDPYDIKKTNISINPIVFFSQGAGLQVGLHHYVNDRLMLTYMPTYIPNMLTLIHLDTSAMSSSLKQRPLFIHQIMADYHLIDYKKSKNVKVVVSSSGTGNHSTVYYESVSSFKRRILAATGGFWVSHGTQTVFIDHSDHKEPVYLINKSNGDKVDINDYENATVYAPEVFSYTRFVNLDIGLKYKNITATAVKYSGTKNKWNDNNFELNANVLLPVYNAYDKEVRRGSSPVYDFIGATPKVGYRVGFRYRTAVRFGITFGFDYGSLPSYMYGGNRNFGTFYMGFSINSGKVTLHEEAYDESSDESDE